MAQIIHPSAQIASEAELADTVIIEANVVIEKDVHIAAGSHVRAGSILHEGSRIGRNCQLGPYALIGVVPLDSAFAGEVSYVTIEDDVRVSNASIARASGEGKSTHIGQGTWIGPYCHIAHNCHIGRDARVISHVAMAGHVTIGDYAFISASNNIHQFVRVGAYTITAAMSGILQDALPFSMVQGRPIKHYRLNKVGLERQGITGERYKVLERAFRLARKREWQAVEALAQESADVKLFWEFKESSARGISKFV